MSTEMPEPSLEELRQIHMVLAINDAANSGGYPPPTSSNAGIDESDLNKKGVCCFL